MSEESPDRDDLVEVTLSGSYQFPTFDRLIIQLTPLLRITEPRPIILDMQRVSFIGPTSIAATPLGGFAAAQAYKKRPTFEIGIVDLGIGIWESFARNPEAPKPQNDLEAIQMALQRGISSNRPWNSGEGLWVTAQALRDNGG